MFREHQQEIREWWQERPETRIVHIGIFVQSSIRARLANTPKFMADYRTFGLSAQWLHNRQRKGSVKFLLNSPDYWSKRIQELEYQPHALYWLLSSMPGFGLVKAGFWAQLLFGLEPYGCLDTHWQKVLSAPQKRRTVQNGQLQRISAYIGLVRELGGSAKLWDNWCAYVAALYPEEFKSAEEVSALHVRAICQS
jgi:hypothetical protein